MPQPGSQLQLLSMDEYLKKIDEDRTQDVEAIIARTNDNVLCVARLVEDIAAHQAYLVRHVNEITVFQDRIAQHLRDHRPVQATVQPASPRRKPYLEPAEVSAILRVPVKTLAQWRSQKINLPYHRIGRHAVYDPEDIEKFALRRKIPTA